MLPRNFEIELKSKEESSMARVSGLRGRTKPVATKCLNSILKATEHPAWLFFAWIRGSGPPTWLLWEEGLGSIPQMTMAWYPEVFKEEIGLSEDLQIICGLAIGYPDEDANVVKVRIPKRRWEEHVTFWE
jgi:hypothetical protein